MDNAQKAIMIGVGLFITIIIISAVLLITNLGTGLINDAQSQLSNISSAVQSQITSSYDGKTMTGNDVISAVQQYQNSNDISVRIVVANNKQFQTGKYGVYIPSQTYSAPTAGGVKVSYKGTNGTETAYNELGTNNMIKDTLSDIQATGGVSGTQTYFTYVMKDSDSDSVVGILFVRKGAGSITSVAPKVKSAS